MHRSLLVRYLFAAFALSISIGVAAPEALAQPTITVLRVDAAVSANGDGSTWTGTSGTGPYKYLQDALDKAPVILAGQPSGSTVRIWVRSKWSGGIGVYQYYPDEDEATGPSPNHVAGDVDETFSLHNRVELYSGFDGTEDSLDDRDTSNKGRAILSGDLDGDDVIAEFLVFDFGSWAENSTHVVTGISVDSTALLDGFVVSHGHSFGDVGAGIGIGADSTPQINDCHIEFNTAGLHGGGMYVFTSSGSTFEMTNCVFYRNCAHGGLGGGLWNDDSSSGTFRAVNCSFIENHSLSGGSGAAVKRPQLINCVFQDNGIDYFGPPAAGGLYAIATSGDGWQITNCVFIRNLASKGGGLYIYSPGGLSSNVVSVNHCTFTGNDATIPGGATGRGGGIYVEGGNTQVHVNNCILWGNTSESTSLAEDQIYKVSGTLTVQYSDVEVASGTYTGTGNINADPLFRSSDNLYLQYTSPCVDAGNDSLLPVDVADLDDDTSAIDPLPEDLNGALRDQDGDGDATAIVDMGAYELAPPDTCAPDINGNCTVNGIDLALLLGAWGPCASCDEDLNGDGVVDGFDLAILLGMWGPCEDCGSLMMFGGGEEEQSEQDEDYPLLLWWLLTSDYASIFAWAETLN